MASGKLDKLCRAVLPPGYEEVSRHAPGIQHFLEQNLPEAVNRSVTLLTINNEEIVIAANSPMVVNYLRLHGNEIRQQLRESFGLEQTLRFRTVPDSLLKIEPDVTLRTPRKVSAEAIAALENNARWIEDEDLRAALMSLAESLKTD